MSTSLPRDDGFLACAPSDLPPSKMSSYSSLTGWNRSEGQSGQAVTMPSNLHAPHANPQSMYTETDRQKHRVSSVSSQATSSCHPPMYMHAHDIAPSPSRYMGPSMSGSAAVTRGLQPEAILAEFYTRKSKKPTLQQQYELCSATGMSSEAVANWFLTTRAADASWSSAQPTRGPHDLQRPRTRFTHEQKAILEMYYLRNPKPGVTDRSRIAVEVGVDLVAVNNWFENRRRGT